MARTSFRSPRYEADSIPYVAPKSKPMFTSVNGKPLSTKPRWRRGAVLYNPGSHISLISRKFATKSLEAEIVPGACTRGREAILVETVPLGRTVKGRDWVEVQLETSLNEIAERTRFLVSEEEDPPFDMIVGTGQEPRRDSNDGTRQSLEENSGITTLSGSPKRIIIRRKMKAELATWLRPIRRFWHLLECHGR